MCDRCKNKQYKHYSGKGIKIHPEWVGPGGFELFLAFMGPKPSPKHSIDRFPDGKGDYVPGNVRWATRHQQAANRDGFCINIEFNGKTQTLAEWGRELGIPYETLRSRHKKMLPTESLLRVGCSRKSPQRFD